MKKLLAILALTIAVSCNTAKQTTHSQKSVVEIRYNVENLNRGFGNAPTEWAMAMKFIDSSGAVRIFYFTDKEVKMHLDRGSKNLGDWIK